MNLLLPIVLTASLAAGADQTELNPVFAALLGDGVAVTDTEHIPLPSPILADSLDRDAQQAALREASGRHGYDRFVRKSNVSPHVYEYREIDDSNAEYLVYGVDVCFVAYGKLDTITKLDPKQFFNLAGNNQDAKVDVLDEDALAAHDIKLAENDQLRERFEHAAYPLFDKVFIEATNQANLTVADESFVRATRLDGRFADSDDFPNRWRKMTITGTGKTEYGEPHVFRGTGMYLKITELIEPEGALFVEYHTVSVEPEAWFNGAPLIRSKLGILLQREVRKFRHTLSELE